MDADLENAVLQLIERWAASRYTERHGLVTAYDPDKHLAKVAFQPEGQESGWLPIETGHIGNSFGIAIGLTPGDGKSTGDQVIVRWQEGDFESGKIVQRVHSEKDTPPKVESGEMVLWTKFRKSGGGQDSADGGQGGTGQQLFFKKDGSAVFTDGNGVTLTFDGAGNVTLAAKSVTWNIDNTVTINGQTINLVGNVHLGGTGGVLAAKLGTLDTGGNADISNLATNVWVT